MHSRIFFIIFFLFLFLCNIKAQVDTEIISKNIKLWFLSELEMPILDDRQINAFVQQRIEIDNIPSEGFKDLLFFKIEDQVLANYLLPNGDTEKILTPIPKSFGQYIIAYSLQEKQLYRITGFEHSDFDEIINNKSYYLIDAGEKKCLKVRHLHKCWEIEGVDMKMLIDESLK